MEYVVFSKEIPSSFATSGARISASFHAQAGRKVALRSGPGFVLGRGGDGDGDGSVASMVPSGWVGISPPPELLRR